MKKKIRFLSALLALALCLSCMALPAFAEEEEECTCRNGPCYPGFVDSTCAVCSSASDPVAVCKNTPTQYTCNCTTHCYTALDIENRKPMCNYCWRYFLGNLGRATAVCKGPETQSVSSSFTSKSAPDVSGHYRTTAECLRNKLKPAEIAQQQLYIDPVTNTIINLYDADGNLITATLSTDGHFYIVPDSSGEYVYIPTGN